MEEEPMKHRLPWDDGGDGTTSDDWAKEWWISEGKEVPPHGTPEWWAMKEQYVEFAFADIRKRSKKYNAEKKRARRRGAAP
jgi:hypothetical protein